MLFVVGAVHVNAGEPKAFVMAGIAPIIGSRNTVSVVVTVVKL